MSKENFFSTVDEGRAAFIDNMKTPREEVEAPDFDIPGLDDEDPELVEDSPKAPKEEDSLILDYTDSQLWSAELTLMKFDEFLGGIIAAFTGQKAEKYQRWNSASTATKERETQLLAAIFNKYQMRMSLEYAFLSLFIMAYAPVFMQAYQDMQAKKKAAKRSTTSANKRGAID